MRISTSKAKKDDFDGIFLLVKQLWPSRKFNKKLLREIFLKELKVEGRCFLIARDKDRIVGFISLMTRQSFEEQGKIGLIDELIVDKEFRGRGIGKKLLEEMLNISRDKSCKAVELFSAFHRKKAHKLYLSEKFKITDLFFYKDL